MNRGKEDFKYGKERIEDYGGCRGGGLKNTHIHSYRVIMEAEVLKYTQIIFKISPFPSKQMKIGKSKITIYYIITQIRAAHCTMYMFNSAKMARYTRTFKHT